MRILMDGTMPSMLPGLPPFAPVSVRLLDILSSEDAVVEQVAELMRLDAHFVAEIVRLANSPVFGFQRKIRSLAHVVALLGAERLRALAASAALKQSGEAHRELHGYWRHSVASGFLAAELADAQGEDLDQAYTGAPLYDAGSEPGGDEAVPRLSRRTRLSNP
jgi:HD-like signal output (HDOD) protein